MEGRSVQGIPQESWRAQIRIWLEQAQLGEERKQEWSEEYLGDI